MAQDFHIFVGLYIRRRRGARSLFPRWKGRGRGQRRRRQDEWRRRQQGRGRQQEHKPLGPCALRLHEIQRFQPRLVAVVRTGESDPEAVGHGAPGQRGGPLPANNPDKAKEIQDRRADNAGDFQQDRQDWKDQNREDWQQYGRNAREDRQDYYNNNYDRYEYNDDWEWGDNVEYPFAAATAIAVGTALTVSAFNSLTCTPTIVSVGGVSYYQCGPNWYNQAYQNGDVVYMSVAAPAGY